MHETQAAYYQSEKMFGQLVRKRLRDYGGYLCKEPETGKFTLAFASLKNAILWAGHVHVELLGLNWPERLLNLEECKTEILDGKTIYRGLRVKIGMAHGRVTGRRPLSTGRADYYGVVPNLAARVCAFARPGQILIHHCKGFKQEDIQWINKDLGIIPYEIPLEAEKHGATEVAVEISNVGNFMLKGVTEPKTLHMVQPFFDRKSADCLCRQLLFLWLILVEKDLTM